MSTLVSFHGDRLYLTAPLKVIKPSTDEIASLSFGSSVTKGAPNDKILWLSGQYVEADVANRNGQMWTTEEVAIKSLTPRLMPVTEMHDPSTAVGVIADTRLLTPEEHGVEHSTIETTLAIWSHRFPQVAEEAIHNAEQGMLMQSMECDTPWFDCSTCGKRHIKPIDESAWCEHLQRGESVRTLGDVTFTGTGLIFGSRGVKGANPKAQMTVLAEVAQWSERNDEKETKMPTIEIERSEYDELKAKAARLDAAEKTSADAQKAADESTAEAKDLGDKLTQTEADLETKTAEAASLKEKVESFEEKASQEELAKQRMSEISADLAKALPDGARTRLAAKARTLSDSDWTDEIASTAELLKVKTDGEQAGNVFAEEAIYNFNPKGKQPDPALSGQEIASEVGQMLRSLRKPAK